MALDKGIQIIEVNDGYELTGLSETQQQIRDEITENAEELWNTGLYTPEQAKDEAIILKLAELQDRIDANYESSRHQIP